MRNHSRSRLLRWIARGAPFFLALPAAAQDASDAAQSEPSTWRAIEDALGGGKAWLKLRYRYENVDDDLNPKEAHASTLRTVLGYESASYWGFSGLIEFQDVSPIGNDLYNSTINGETDRPVVADPDGTEVNQVYLGYAKDDLFGARLGRQRIILDTQRFVGNVGWRQNEQTFDAASATGDLAGFDLFYGYVNNVNRVFGEQSPVGDHGMSSHLLHASGEIGDAAGASIYAYLLDYDEVDALSTNTFGTRFTGRFDLGDVGIPWTAEIARQVDAGDNPNDVDADYVLLELGAEVQAVTFEVGWELLEGSGATGDAFQTPLATLHAFNGWADKFLVTPDTGLEDLYASLGCSVGKVRLLAVYHDFTSDAGSIEYGTELDLRATYPVQDNMTLGLKAASFQAGDAPAIFDDTLKLWVWLSWTVL